MIDWYSLLANALWVLALALALAAFSYTSWQASIQSVSLRKKLQEADFQRVLNLAGTLFCLGLAATSGKTWEQAVWAGLGFLFLLQIVWSLIEKARHPK